MKIEMGESLALSWLRHVKKCSIVQANWKPSFEWEERDDWFVEQVLQKAHEYFEERGFPVLPYEKGRHTVDAYNVLMQTECDGIGVKVGRGTSGNEYFAIESALKSLGIKFEEFLGRCETFKGVERMLNDLNDEGGSRGQAIRDYASNMKWDELGLKKKLSKRDIEYRACAEQRGAVYIRDKLFA